MIDLRGFIGTEHYHKLDLFSGYLATDGVKEMAEQFNAYWLASDILICQKMVNALREQPFVIWKLKKSNNPEKAAQLIADDGNGQIIYTQDYLVTNFPFGKYISDQSDATTFTLFFTDGILLLLSEN